MKLVIGKIIPGLVLATLLASVLACGTPPALPTATAPASLPPTQISLPTQTSLPLYQSVTLSSTNRNETSIAPAPVYTLNAQIPVLQGSSDVRVTAFNNEKTLLT